MSRAALLREKIRRRDGEACFYCGEPMRFSQPKNPFAMGAQRRMATLEHLVDLKHGGTWAMKNCVLAHGACNNSRNYMTLAEKLASRSVPAEPSNASLSLVNAPKASERTKSPAREDGNG